MGLATTIRIGNLLGEGNAAAAKVSGQAGAVIIGCFILILMGVITTLRNDVPRLYAS